MKPHIVLKLRRPLADELGIADWVTFIRDKSLTKDSVDPEVDRLLRGLGVKFWVTKEYQPAGRAFSADEVRAGLDRTYRLILREDYQLPPDLVDRIKLTPNVEDARALDVVEAPVPAPQTAVAMSTGPGPADLIHLRYAHAFTKGSRDVKVAVLDTGVHLTHPELRGRVAASADFVNLDGLDTSEFIGDVTGYDDAPDDEVGHGTHVAGIIGGQGAEMDEGVAPGCNLMAVRVLATMRGPGGSPRGAGIIDNINVGIKWAVDRGADVINLSLGIKHVGGGLPHEDVIRYALGKGVTVVAASGNDGTAERYYPGALPGVIAVGAVDQTGRVARFSSYGANITVVAPGDRIYSSFANGTYAYASGTSQAAPFVSGVIGLMKSFARSRGKRLRDDVITYVLKHTSDKVDSRLRNEQAGYGLINTADAFRLLSHLAT